VAFVRRLGHPKATQSQTQSAEGRKLVERTKRNGFPLRGFEDRSPSRVTIANMKRINQLKST
jgi:hypothetical protein